MQPHELARLVPYLQRRARAAPLHRRRRRIGIRRKRQFGSRRRPPGWHDPRIGRLDLTSLRLVLLSTLALVATALAGCGSGAGTSVPAPSPYAGIVRDPAPRVGHDVLPDVARGGAPTAMKGAAGGLLLVFFGYTSCPDVCPTTMSDLRVALRGLPAADRARVRVAMVTVDPRRDTPAVLTRYVRTFFPAGLALRTASPARLARVARSFGAAYEVTRRANGTVDVVHTAYVYAVDGDGRLRLQWGFGTRPAAYRKDVRRLLSVGAGTPAASG